MTVRRQTLEEWFTDHQLSHIGREHFHIPVTLNVDITQVERAWAEAGKRMPLTATVVKAVALTAAEHPECNRTIFRTFTGTWVVDFEHTDVNVPLMVEHQGRKVLSAMVVKDAADKSVFDISTEIREAGERRLEDLPIGRHFIRNRNTLYNRTKLRLLHWAVWNLPWAYERRRGGGVAVTSLVNSPGHAIDISAVSRGPHVLTVGAFARYEEEGRTMLRLGIGYDHAALHGHDFFVVMGTLDDILSGKKHPEALTPRS